MEEIKPTLLKERFRKASAIAEMVKFNHMGDKIDYISEANLIEWLEREREDYSEDPAYPLGQRVLIGTFVSNLIHKIEKRNSVSADLTRTGE